MGSNTLSDLKRALKVPQKRNRQGFERIANRVLSLSRHSRSEYSLAQSLEYLKKSYFKLAALVVGSQDLETDELRSGVKAVTEELVLHALKIHLHSFRSKLLEEGEREAFRRLVGEMKRTFTAKNDDYGSVFRFWGIPGLVVRIGDKCFRLERLSEASYKRKVEDERRMDTALDLANYGVMLLMLLDEGRSFQLGR